ncbi:MAG: ATP-binding protein [Limisphaerales bacterium]
MPNQPGANGLAGDLVDKRSNRLLIIDDNRAIHDDFRKILNPDKTSSSEHEEALTALFGEAPSKGSACANTFQLDSAYQGEEGLGLVRKAVKQGRPYSTAFIDVRMPPGWDGVETTSKIWEVDPDLQVVICTAYSDCSWQELLGTLGGSDRLVILRKPFDTIEVLQLANSLTRKWHLLQESKGKMASLETMIMTRTAEIVQEQEKFKVLFDNSPEGIFQTSEEGRFLTANPAMASICGYASPEELIEQVTDMQNQLYADPGRRNEFKNVLREKGAVRDFDLEIKCKDGSRRWISLSASVAAKPDGSLRHFQGFAVDITAQKEAQKDRNFIEVQLRQAQKLEAVGQLAAGIAHEINTPIQYVGDNIHFIEESFAALTGLLQDFKKLAAAVRSNTVTQEVLSAVETSMQKADLDYLSKEIPLAVQQSLQGVAHVSRIVNAMKEFSHPGGKEKESLDLNHAIEMTVTVARNEWKYVAGMETDFAPELPPVPCLPGEFNQVILNLIVNAAHAIGDVVKKVEGSKGTIRVSTRLDGDWVEIRVSDTGTGIAEEIRHRIFDPFFTTKGVGKGTGQGLAIARSVIVDKHGGTLTFESEVGRGTTFIIRLPTQGSAGAGKGA